MLAFMALGMSFFSWLSIATFSLYKVGFFRMFITWICSLDEHILATLKLFTKCSRHDSIWILFCWYQISCHVKEKITCQGPKLSTSRHKLWSWSPVHILLVKTQCKWFMERQIKKKTKKKLLKQGLTNPLPGRPGQALNHAGQVCSVFMTPGRASAKKKITGTVSCASIYGIEFSAINRSVSKSW